MFKQSSIFEYRLEDEAINLRKQAEGMPHGIRRDELLRKAGQIDVRRDTQVDAHPLFHDAASKSDAAL